MNKLFRFELFLVVMLILATLTMSMSVQRRGVRNDYYKKHFKRFVYDQPSKVVHKSLPQEEDILDEPEDYPVNQKAKQAALWKRKSLQKRVPIQCLINIIACW